jgi:hypothetical protein
MGEKLVVLGAQFFFFGGGGGGGGGGAKKTKITYWIYFLG